MVASCKINLQSKHNLICHVVKVKAAKSAHSMAMQYLVTYLLFPLNPTLRLKENAIRNIVRVLMFQQRLASKHYRLCDSKLAEWRSVSGYRRKK